LLKKTMKAIKITYWTTTALLAAMMTFSAYAYLTQPEIKQGFRHLGFPDYFRVELAIAKLLGAVVLLVPLASRLKEWAYAGFAITFVSAFVAHTALADPVSSRVGPVIALVLLAVSYLTYHKRSTAGQKPGVVAHPEVALQG
jgi:hypothetical protein